MTQTFFEPYRNAIFAAPSALPDLNLPSNDIVAALIDMNVQTPAPITGAAQGTPIVITAVAHGLSSGARIAIQGVVGNLAANGVHLVVNPTANTFEITNELGAPIVSTGAYTSGGQIMSLDLAFGDELVGAAVLAQSPALANKTAARSIFDADNVVFSSVPAGDEASAVVLSHATGNAATSPLIAWFGQDAFNGLPWDTDGEDITLEFASTGILRAE